MWSKIIPNISDVDNELLNSFSKSAFLNQISIEDFVEKVNLIKDKYDKK